MKQTFDVTGMTCAASSARVEKATRAVPGVADVAVNLLKNSMDISFDDGAEPSAVTAAVEAAVDMGGYGAAARVPAGARGLAGIAPMPVFPLEQIAHFENFRALAGLHGQSRLSHHRAAVLFHRRPEAEAEDGITPLLALIPGAHVRVAEIVPVGIHNAPVLQYLLQVGDVPFHKLAQKQALGL